MYKDTARGEGTHVQHLNPANGQGVTTCYEATARAQAPSVARKRFDCELH